MNNYILQKTKNSHSVGAQAAMMLIRGYQKWISPRKGFCCAYRYFTGARGCSEFG
jgi:putative component of membrane protein insertase Oxa1/YidC/SpoIIIJ protein YidD